MNTRHVYAVPPRLSLNQWDALRRMDAEDMRLLSERCRRPDRIPVTCARSPPHHGASRAPWSCTFSSGVIDGQPPTAGHGNDVDDQGNGTVTEHRLFQLIRQSRPIADRHSRSSFSTRTWKHSHSRSADGYAESIEGSFGRRSLRTSALTRRIRGDSQAVWRLEPRNGAVNGLTSDCDEVL